MGYGEQRSGNPTADCHFQLWIISLFQASSQHPEPAVYSIPPAFRSNFCKQQLSEVCRAGPGQSEQQGFRFLGLTHEGNTRNGYLNPWCSL